MMTSGYPRMVYVYLNAACPLGHHEFADSVNNGPWGKALTEELIPALEHQFAAGGNSDARFLTGHSSGGWSSFWLQVTYPDFFGGTWSTSPDSVDFRDFTGIDVYRFQNAYTDPDGKEIQLMRNKGEFVTSIKQYVTSEVAKKDYGGQFASFDAVFSPRGEDGRPMPMFDRKTGAIDSFVAKSWEKYDISLILRRNWTTLGPKLKGKLHVFVGTLDTFRLEGPLYLLRDDLKQLGSDAVIEFAEGRDHRTVMAPHKLWPDGLMPRIHKEMRARFDHVAAPAEAAK
jgi:S-formylglutathione hydrolase FrmB